MRKISIITLVSFFFALTLVVINIALALEYKRQQSDAHYFAFQRFIMAVKLLRDTPKEEVGAQLNALHVKISKKEKETLRQMGKPLLEDPFFEMIDVQNKLYFVPKSELPPPPLFEKHPHPRMPPPHQDVLLEDVGEYSMHRFWVLSVVINALLLLFFTVVMQKLLRLKGLKHAIRSFGERKTFKAIAVDGEDELGEIAQEFNIAMAKIHDLKEARTLFLRNILHELKTPIMKGKIVSNSLREESKKEPLNRVFERLESLLGEMVNVEKLSANECELVGKEYRLVDVLDHAYDLLMSDTSRLHVSLQGEAPLVHVDFELFATALKNLLDNALKYSQEGIDIVVETQSIEITSIGEALSPEQSNFSRAFNRTVEGSTKGLGLGLYIANAIVLKHGFNLNYTHTDGKNHFTIRF